MNLISNDTYLDYSDVLIVPGRQTTINSRKDVNLNVEYTLPYANFAYTGTPVMAANMMSIGTPEIAERLAKDNMFTCLHKDFTEIYQDLNHEKISRDNYAVTIGIGNSEIETIRNIFESESIKPKYVCIDIANGHMLKLIQTVQAVRNIIKDQAAIIAGNVVTPDAALDLAQAGADIVKVGIGPGSVCTTRIKTGCGLPQLTAVSKIAEQFESYNFRVVADGGCTCPGDIAKAFAAGADFVMLGGMLSGHDETGTHFFGSSSERAMILSEGKLNTYRASEGREIITPEKGPLSATLQDITGGVRSACSYVGVNKLSELRHHAQFAKVNHQYNTMYTERA